MRVSEIEGAWWAGILLVVGALAIGCGWVYNCYCVPMIEALTSALG